MKNEDQNNYNPNNYKFTDSTLNRPPSSNNIAKTLNPSHS